jgi:hypothetical protein
MIGADPSIRTCSLNMVLDGFIEQTLFLYFGIFWCLVTNICNEMFFIFCCLFYFSSETPVSAMGEDSNHSVMSDSQDATDFSNKINPSTAGPTPTSKADPNAIAKE